MPWVVSNMLSGQVKAKTNPVNPLPQGLFFSLRTLTIQQQASNAAACEHLSSHTANTTNTHHSNLGSRQQQVQADTLAPLSNPVLTPPNAKWSVVFRCVARSTIDDRSSPIVLHFYLGWLTQPASQHLGILPPLHW